MPKDSTAMAEWKPFFQPTGRVPIVTKDILSAIFDTDKYDADEPIYVDPENPEHSLSKRQCEGLIRQLIAGLRATSLTPGDCVCVHAFNNLYYSCLFLAVVGAGFVWTGTNPGYSKYELVHHFKTSKARFLIVEPELIDTATPAARESGIEDSSVLSFDHLASQGLSGRRLKSWRSLLQHQKADWLRFDDLGTACATTACLLFSSGTTGLPKAASISHYNLVAQHTLLHEQVAKPYKISRILCLPFFHAAMVPLGHITPLMAGHVSYVMRRFQLENFLSHTEKHHVTEIFVVPPIIISILQSSLTDTYSLKSLRWGMTGGAPLDLQSQLRFSALMNEDGCLNPCYGMTELSCIGATYSWPERDVDGSAGYFLPNLEIMLLDENDAEVRSYNSRGELCVRGPTVISGYLNNEEANRSSFLGPWFRTGDIAYCDEGTKKWYIVDRKKELIKVRGFQVAPPELEAVLMSHPQILDAAVIGVPAVSAIDGEVPRAYIVRRDEPGVEKITESEVKKYLASRLAKYKALGGGVVFLQNLPKTASGKHLKRQLRELAKRETPSAVGSRL